MTHQWRYIDGQWLLRDPDGVWTIEQSGRNAFRLCRVQRDGVSVNQVAILTSLEGAQRMALQGSQDDVAAQPVIRCGHSACRQNYIDTGEVECVVARDANPCLECIDGWVPGENGVERCDTCKRFADDDAAADHVREILRTLAATYSEYEEDDGEPAWIRRCVRDDEGARS